MPQSDELSYEKFQLPGDRMFAHLSSRMIDEPTIFCVYGSFFNDPSNPIYLDVVFSSPFNKVRLRSEQNLMHTCKLSEERRKPYFENRYGKTRGVLWLGVYGSWRKRLVEFWDEKRARQPVNTYRVELSPDTCLIIIDSPESAQKFFKAFGKTEYNGFGRPSNHSIQWERVRQYCDGIFINLPYWGLSDMEKYPGTEWLDTYDCKSVAIWHVKSGTTFQRILFKKEARQAKREGWSSPKIEY